jgi:hypothetical protein
MQSMVYFEKIGACSLTKVHNLKKEARITCDLYSDL